MKKRAARKPRKSKVPKLATRDVIAYVKHVNERLHSIAASWRGEAETLQRRNAPSPISQNLDACAVELLHFANAVGINAANFETMERAR